MSTYDARLRSREEIAEGTMAFHFEKPPGFTFKPGQAIDLILAVPPVNQMDNSRHAFSLVSAPFEGELVVATRMRDSAYKRILSALPLGSLVQLEGPFGSLTLHHNQSRPAVFMAGGIGITPFMSMLRQAARDRLPQQLLLIYSNRRPEDAAFLAELLQLEQRNSSFRLLATMTEMGKSRLPWAGETALIGDELVKKAAGKLVAPIYYLVGPPAMVEAMRQTLNGMGIDDDDIRSEEFYGY